MSSPSAAIVLRPAKRPPPFFTVTSVFNAIGWIVLGLMLWLLVIPAIRFGYWKDFSIATTWEFIWEGLRITLYVGVFSVVISTIVGFILALGRLANNKVVAWMSAGYIELMRALPSYLIIFYVFIVFPKIGISMDKPWMAKIGLTIYTCSAIVGLTFYTSAVMAEIFRAGILSVEKGQFEAAYALGLKPRHTVVHIVLPQALRRMVPAIVSQLITLTKDTSLASVIGVQELTRQGKTLYEFYSGEPGHPPVILEMLFAVALIYFIICYTLSIISSKLEIKAHT